MRSRGRHAAIFGSIRAVVELPCAVDITELLAHELEHVLEQAEGLDLPALAKDSSSGVLAPARGVYETERARNAGLAAMREVYGQTDRRSRPPVRGVRRAFAALIPGARAATGAAAGRAGSGGRRQPEPRNAEAGHKQ